MDPFKTDNAATARTLMIHELSEALLGESFARSERPETVWAELLATVGAAAGVVASSDLGALRRNNAELLAARRVVAATRPWHTPSAHGPCDTCRALAAYDQAVVP